MRTLLFIVLSLGVALSVFGQRRDMTPEQRRERVETVIIGKFAEELELTPAEAEKFYPRLRQFRAETDGLQRELLDTRQRLDAISKSGDQSAENEVPASGLHVRGGRSTEAMTKSLSSAPSVKKTDEKVDGEQDIKVLISKSNSLQTEILDKREALLTDLADFLTPQQVSRCSILLDEMPRRIRQFMDERGGPPDGRERGRGEQKRRERTR
jgi:hypothetical protein